MKRFSQPSELIGKRKHKERTFKISLPFENSPLVSFLWETRCGFYLLVKTRNFHGTVSVGDRSFGGCWCKSRSIRQFSGGFGCPQTQNSLHSKTPWVLHGNLALWHAPSKEWQNHKGFLARIVTSPPVLEKVRMGVPLRISLWLSPPFPDSRDSQMIPPFF